MPVPSLTGNLGAGFDFGSRLGELQQNKKNQKLAAEQQSLLGGLRRQSLGLGASQREDIRRQVAEISPDALKDLDQTLEQFDAPKIARLKEENSRLSSAADNALQFDDAQLPQGLNATASAYFQLGGDANEKTAETILQFAERAKTDPAAVRNEIQAIRNSALQIGKALDGREEKIDVERRKEERQQAKNTVNRLTKDATRIKTAFNGIMTLLDQNSRAANASVFQLVARLASPGIVTEKEAASLAGGAAPIAALATAFDDKGAGDIGELIRKSIDPTNPANFDTEGMRKLAEGLTASQVPFLLEELEGAKFRATRSGISKTAFDTNFGDTRVFDGLSRFVNKGSDQNSNDLNDDELAELQALEAEFGGQ